MKSDPGTHHRPAPRAIGSLSGDRSAHISLLPESVPETWGGKRRGAGRKPVVGRAPTPHRARPLHSDSHPVHVTMRSHFRPLRSRHVEPTIRLAIAAAGRRFPERFRIIGYSIQYDHIHLIVEAQDRAALSSGMRGLSIRIALWVNKLVSRRGRFWADRWWGRALTTPREVRTALLYVLANYRKHSRRFVPPGIDSFSSGRWFDGWDLDADATWATGTSARSSPTSRWEANARPTIAPDGETSSDGESSGDREAAGPATSVDSATMKGAETRGKEKSPVRPSRTWLGSVGWRRLGLLRLDEAPASAPRTFRRMTDAREQFSTHSADAHSRRATPALAASPLVRHLAPSAATSDGVIESKAGFRRCAPPQAHESWFGTGATSNAATAFVWRRRSIWTR